MSQLDAAALPNAGLSPILRNGDPAPVSVARRGGRTDLLLIGDHAGNAVPLMLGNLGLAVPDQTRHIAWDIGVRALGEGMAEILGATFVHQHFSRLVIDCNRDPQSATAILALSDGTAVPGNIDLDEAAREQRRIAIHAPYHQRIGEEIAARRHPGRDGPLIVALHSFTATFGREQRPWHIGVLHDKGNTRVSHAMFARLREESDIVVGDNEPYRMDGTDYTIPHHAYPGALPYLELEFRNDLLRDQGAQYWATRAAKWIEDVMPRI